MHAFCVYVRHYILGDSARNTQENCNMKNVFYILTLLLLLASCSSYEKVLKSRDIEYKYETAKSYYLEGSYSNASILLEGTIAMMKGSDKAEESLFMLAMCYYKSHDFSTASQYFKTFYTNYQRSELTELARFYSGKSLFEAVREPELDQTDTYTAIQELQLFMEYHPMSDFYDEAQQMLYDMYDVLVKKEYLSAKLYYDLGDHNAYLGNNYQACIITAQNALKDYPYTKLREDLSILILRAKYHMARNSVEDKKIERYRSAIDEYYSFKNEFPASKYLKEADGYFSKAMKIVNG